MFKPNSCQLLQQYNIDITLRYKVLFFRVHEKQVTQSKYFLSFARSWMETANDPALLDCS